MGENIVFWVIIFFTTVPIFGMGIYAFVKKTPIHFYAGTTVKSEEITDVKSYNRANGFIWAGYGLGLIIFAIIMTRTQGSLGSILFLVYTFAGLLAMLLAYRAVYEKYRKKTMK